jgi:hypothetical protein
MIFAVDGNQDAAHCTFANDEKMRIVGATGKVGIGTSAPGHMLVAKGAAGTSPTFEMINSDTEDGDTSRESSIRFSGFRSGGEAMINAQIGGHHDGSSDDDKGMLLFATNSGTGHAEKMRITSGGDVGIGTTTPSGFTPSLTVYGTQPSICAAKDSTNFWSTIVDSGLVTTHFDDSAYWRIGTASNHGNTSFSEKFRIQSNGYIGFNCSAPENLMHLKNGFFQFESGSAPDYDAKVEAGGGGHLDWYRQQGSSSWQHQMRLHNNLQTYTNNGNVYSLSDIRVKKNIVDLSDGLATINQLRPVTFEYNGKSSLANNDGTVQYGLIADEVLETDAAHYVTIDKEEIDGTEVEDFKSLSTGEMIPMMMKAIQELSAKNDALEAKVTALENA